MGYAADLLVRAGATVMFSEVTEVRDAVHLLNFIDAIRKGTSLNSEIEEGHKSTLLCHLGNIAYRTGRAIHFDPAARRIAGDGEAMKFWAREYRKGWEPKV